MNRAVTCFALLFPTLTLTLACVPKEEEGDTQADAATETETEAGTTETETTETETETETGTTETETTETGTTETETTETETTETGETETGETETGTETETESGETESGETETDTDSETETETGGACEENDEFELNDVPEDAMVFEWGNGPHNSIYKSIDAYLCSDEEDWYRFNISNIEFDFDDEEYYGLHVDGIVLGSSWCGEGCEEPFLPDAPENSIGIHIYDAETLELLDNSLSPSGRVDINGSGEAYSHDLLVRVYGPSAAATYGYALHFEIRAYNGEDECEC